jgi:uncharacterized membrane protein
LSGVQQIAFHPGREDRAPVIVSTRRFVVAATVDRLHEGSLHAIRRIHPIHPLHAILLASIVPLFLGILLSDIAYYRSYQIQWKNFSSWLIVGGVSFGFLALLWGLVDLLRSSPKRGRPLVYVLLLLATCLLGFINGLVHAQDAWESMPTALVLAVITAVLAIAATAVGFSTLRAGVLK